VMILEPCKDCPDRHPICHDSCPRYAEYKRQLKEQRALTLLNFSQVKDIADLPLDMQCLSLSDFCVSSHSPR
jgi:hypothetical protein